MVEAHAQSNRSPGGRLAALDGERWHVEGEPPRPAQAVFDRARGDAGVTALFHVMDALELGVLYVHASALPRLGLPAELEVPRPGERRPPHPFLACTYEGEQPSRRALAPSIELAAGERPRGGERRRLEVLIGAYQDGAGDPFAGARDGAELLAAALAYADALAERGRRWALRNSTAVTGWNLMHAPYSRAGRRRDRPLDGDTNPQPVLKGVGDAAQVEVPYGSWARELELEPLPYVAAWDVNGQRLAACSRLPLGIGGLEYVGPGQAFAGGGEAGRRELLKHPGYHLVKAVHTPHAGAIPPIFTPGWHTTPRVAMAAYLELEPVIVESWLWTDHRPYLDPFYNRMRAAREQLLERMGLQDGASQLIAGERAAAIALEALKQTYLQPFGRLRSARLREARDVRYRPAWYDAIIGQELARQYLRLHQLADAGERVLAVYFDAIVLEIPEPGYTPAALEVSPQLGKFKLVGELAAEQALEVLRRRGDGPDVGGLLKALKAGGVAAGERRGQPLGRSVAPPALSAFTRPAHGGYPGQVAA